MASDNREMRKIEQWNNMNSVGKKQYIGLNLKLDLFRFILLTVILQIINDGLNFNSFSFSNQHFIKQLIASFVIFPVCGYIGSIIEWKWYEKKYNS